MIIRLRESGDFTVTTDLGAGGYCRYDLEAGGYKGTYLEADGHRRDDLGAGGHRKTRNILRIYLPYPQSWGL